MTTHSSKIAAYSAVIESGTRPTARICAGNKAVLSFPLLAREDVNRFVDFLNENQIEPVHVKDCFRDYLFDRYADSVSPDD